MVLIVGFISATGGCESPRRFAASQHIARCVTSRCATEAAARRFVYDCFMENHFFRDARRVLKLAAGLIASGDSVVDDSIDDDALLVATTMYALGVERVLKALLWDTNPMYVFEDLASSRP